MSAKQKKKRRASGYNAATPKSTANPSTELAPSGESGTFTLILTPKLIRRFGGVFRAEFRIGSRLAAINNVFQEALTNTLLPITKSKSVLDFEDRVKKGFIAYSKHYDDIILECERILGSSRFKIEYVKQITEIDKDLRALPFASLDLTDLFRRHIVCCTNVAANYEELFKNDAVTVHTVDGLLRTSNYGLTVLVLLLEGTLTGPLWIMGELHRLTSDALNKIESMPGFGTHQGRLAGSLTIKEGVLA